MIVNGKRQQYIEIADRACQYGDGCFTTIAYRNGNIELFDAHIERLKLACSVLFINFIKWSELSACIVESITFSTDCVIKVIITRGQGGRGYSPEGTVNPSFIITHHPIPAHYDLWQTDGINLTVSPVSLAQQPLLAGIKHLNRLEQVLVKHALSQTEFVDAVVCDTQQKVIESSIGNLFWLSDDVWYTPDLCEAGVEGVMRNLVLDVLQENSLKYQVVKQDVSDLFKADCILVCNSLMTLVPVLSLFNPSNQETKLFATEKSKQLQNDAQQAIRRKVIKL